MVVMMQTYYLCIGYYVDMFCWFPFIFFYLFPIYVGPTRRLALADILPLLTVCHVTQW